MKRIVIIALLNFTILQLFAQTRITGNVKDESGLGMIGASIVQKGTSNGVITDTNGNFSITLKAGAPNILQISMVGFIKENIDVSKITSLKVVLKESHLDLDEVVVIGYGTQKKASITGSISNVGADDLKKVPVSSSTNALTGQIPGLVTRQISGRPGGDEAQLFIRGQASFNNTDPLVLVDGVERSFGQIDPDDIESISVLKDASATAVYGVRGANGVVLVTTKRGAVGKSKITFSTEYGITEFMSISRQLNAETTSRLMREGSTNLGLDVSQVANTNQYPTSEYDNYLYRTQLSPFDHPDNNFIDIFTKPGSQQKYNLNLTGGNQSIKYFVAFGYFNQDGMYQTDVNEIRKNPTIQKLIALSPDVDKTLVNPNYDPSYNYKRINARSNLDIQLSKDFKIGIDLSYRFGRKNRPAAYAIIDGGDGEGLRIFASFMRVNPQAFALLLPNGSYGTTTGQARQNPIVTLAHSGYILSFDNDLESSLNLNYNLHKVLKGLTLDGKFSFDNSWTNWRGMGERPATYSYNSINQTYTQLLANALPKLASVQTSPTTNEYAEAALRYQNSFAKKHNVSAVALVNFSSSSAPIVNSDYSYVPHIYQALIGRVNYDYDTRYLLEVNMGYNGSNRFAVGHRYAIFPSASVGWVLTNESFVPQNDFLNFFKFRVSSGKVGNDKLGNFSYYYKSTYSNTGQPYSFGTTQNTLIPGWIEGALSNNSITWETSTKYNVGFDSKWLKSRLSLSVDLFKENRTDILTTPQQFILSAGTNGLPPFNLGAVENKGFEVELGWNHTIGKFNYFAKGMVAYAHNTIIEKSEASQPYNYLYQKGHPINQFFGYQFVGFFKSYEEIAAAPNQFGASNLMPGDMRYKDINGDGVIDANDMTAIGYSSLPELTFSGQFGFNYNGFDFSMMLQGASRVSIYPSNDVAWDLFGYYDSHLGRWTPETASTATYPVLRTAAVANTNNYVLSTFWLKDGTYLRLKNLQIGYTFPKKWFKKTPINSVRIYANGYNLITFDNIQNVDPEMDPNTNNGMYYPQQKIYNTGINITF